jgi:hypothetical protein
MVAGVLRAEGDGAAELVPRDNVALIAVQHKNKENPRKRNTKVGAQDEAIKQRIDRRGSVAR